MKKNLIIAGVVVGLVLLWQSSVFADSIVNWSAGSTTGLQLGDGSNLALPQGDWIALVTLNTGVSESDIQTAFNAGNLTTVISDLKIYGTSTVGTGAGVDGAFSTQSSSSDNSFFGLQIYIAAANTSNPASATQFGLWTTSQWTFPDATAIGGANTTSIDLESANHAALGVLTSASTDLKQKTGFNLAAQLELLPVPEPSSFVLAALGILGAAGLIRRRR